MRPDEIRELLDREPFEPFRLVLSSGVTYDILNPGLVVAMKSYLFIAFPDGERWVFCPYLHISSVERLQVA